VSQREQPPAFAQAAAIKGRADLIVTFNLKDFPGDRLDRWGIEAQHPDESTDLSRRAGAVKERGGNRAKSDPKVVITVRARRPLSLAVSMSV
jgi:hypothetical protein